MNRRHYPSDISREQFEPIRGMLEGLQHKTRPRRVDLYDVFCAILYLLKNATVWRALPSDFPSVSTVRYYFDLWNRAGSDDGSSLLAQALKKSGGKGTRAQRTQALDEFFHRGRTKRHIAVDTQGLPHAVWVTTVEVTDRAGALAMFA